MRKSLYALFLLLGINVWGQEQEIEPINTDRPDQNEGTYVLPKGTFQIEGGLQYSEGEFAPSLMLRYGLLKGTEIRLDTDFGKDIWHTQFNDFTLSVKQRLLNKENLPAFTLVGYLAYDDTEGDRINADLLLAVDYEFLSKWSLTYNIGSSDGFENMVMNSQLGYSFAEKWTAFGEYYGTFGAVRPKHNLSAGLKYLLTNDLQLDAIAGFSVFKSESDNFVALGVAYRFKNKNKQQNKQS